MLISLLIQTLFLQLVVSGSFANSTDTLRNLFGAMLMGTGGVLALGCTVGQAITGFSTLAVGSMLAFAAIVVGGFAGVHYLNRLIMAEV